MEQVARRAGTLAPDKFTSPIRAIERSVLDHLAPTETVKYLCKREEGFLSFESPLAKLDENKAL